MVGCVSCHFLSLLRPCSPFSAPARGILLINRFPARFVVICASAFLPFPSCTCLFTSEFFVFSDVACGAFTGHAPQSTFQQADATCRTYSPAAAPVHQCRSSARCNFRCTIKLFLSNRWMPESSIQRLKMIGLMVLRTHSFTTANEAPWYEGWTTAQHSGAGPSA